MPVSSRRSPALARFSLALALATLPAGAATYVVDRTDDVAAAQGCVFLTDDDCSLRGAILKANADGIASTVLLPEGHYLLTIPGAGEDAAAVGDLDVTAPITLGAMKFESATIEQTAVDRVFDLHPINGEVRFLGHLTLSGGSADLVTSSYGGSIRAQGVAELLLEGTKLEHANARDDGGCFHYVAPAAGGTLTVRYVEMRSCEARVSGGGAFVFLFGASEVVFERTTIADSEAGGSGGGLLVAFGSGVVSLVDSSLLDNRAGGVALNYGWGGGLRVVGAHVRLEGTTVARNLAGGPGVATAQGGGIRANNGALVELRNSTVSGNRVEAGAGFGAAVFFDDSSTLDLAQATIAANLPDYPTAIGLWLQGGSDLVTEASILAERCFVDPPGTATSQGYNVERLESGAVTTCGLVNPSDVVTAAPVVRPLAGNGGPTATHALADGSPAQLLVASGACFAEDQRHAPRALLFCDAGAYESSGTPPGPWLFADGFESGDTSAWSAASP